MSIVSENKEILASITHKSSVSPVIEDSLLIFKEEIKESKKALEKINSKDESPTDFEITENDVSKYLSFLESSKDDKITPNEILQELKEKTTIDYSTVGNKKSEQGGGELNKKNLSDSGLKRRTNTENSSKSSQSQGSVVNSSITDSKPKDSISLRKGSDIEENVALVSHEADDEDLEELAALSVELMPGGAGSQSHYEKSVVYTIHEDEAEDNSPTTSDGVSRPRKLGKVFRDIRHFMFTTFGNTWKLIQNFRKKLLNLNHTK